MRWGYSCSLYVYNGQPANDSLHPVLETHTATASMIASWPNDNISLASHVLKTIQMQPLLSTTTHPI